MTSESLLMSIVAFVYKPVRISIHIFTSSMYSNVITSTRNKFNKCTYVHLCLFHSKPVQHIQYSTWCQNRGCICISSTRRTYRLNPAVSCILPSILNVQFYKVEFPKKRREKIQGEILQSSQSSFYKSYNSIPQNLPDFQCFYMQSKERTEFSFYFKKILPILQEILQLQGSSHAHRYKASSSNCSLCIQAFYMAETPPKLLTAHSGFQ